MGSLADREGKLFPGDEIIEFDGVPVNSFEAIQKAMDSASQKNVLKLIVKTPGMRQLRAHIRSHSRPEQKVCSVNILSIIILCISSNSKKFSAN